MADVSEILKWLERRGSKRNRDGMARFGIVAPKVFGVSVSDLRAYAKTLGKSHALALALWKTGWYEARMLAAFVDEPARVTPAQMDRWALRGIGHRNAAMRREALAVARRLAVSDDKTSRWVGKDAIRDLAVRS